MKILYFSSLSLDLERYFMSRYVLHRMWIRHEGSSSSCAPKVVLEFFRLARMDGWIDGDSRFFSSLSLSLFIPLCSSDETRVRCWGRSWIFGSWILGSPEFSPWDPGQLGMCNTTMSFDHLVSPVSFMGMLVPWKLRR